MKHKTEKKKWKLYYPPLGSKWRAYTGFSSRSFIEDLLAEVDRDPHGLFRG
ncbi:MAG: DUF3024 domain-containing protein [Syntrophales bacterium]|nr:DUF3024 domain-containing protein [Syntrophales bacterium]